MNSPWPAEHQMMTMRLQTSRHSLQLLSDVKYLRFVVGSTAYSSLIQEHYGQSGRLLRIESGLAADSCQTLALKGGSRP
jgi:hypothetical protein